MPTYTKYFGFEKPSEDDYVDINKINQTFDLIDEYLAFPPGVKSYNFDSYPILEMTGNGYLSTGKFVIPSYSADTSYQVTSSDWAFYDSQSFSITTENYYNLAKTVNIDSTIKNRDIKKISGVKIPVNYFYLTGPTSGSVIGSITYSLNLVDNDTNETLATSTCTLRASSYIDPKSYELNFTGMSAAIDNSKSYSFRLSASARVYSGTIIKIGEGYTVFATKGFENTHKIKINMIKPTQGVTASLTQEVSITGNGSLTILKDGQSISMIGTKNLVEVENGIYEFIINAPSGNVTLTFVQYYLQKTMPPATQQINNNEEAIIELAQLYSDMEEAIIELASMESQPDITESEGEING